MAINEYTSAAKDYREMAAKELWTANQLANALPPERVSDIMIQRQVNEMDPDFSFTREMFGQPNTNTTIPRSQS